MSVMPEIESRTYESAVLGRTGLRVGRLGLAARPGESIHQYGWHLTTLFGYMPAAGIAKTEIEPRTK